LAPGARGVPAETAFLYQGQLKHMGAAMDDQVDLLFTLWDAETDGTQMGENQIDGVTPSNGLFQVEVDFGLDPFGGDARWLEISVRYPSGGGQWTELGRQPITATPYAMYAMSDANWARNGGAIFNTNPGFVGINRDHPVGSEWFGVHAPVDDGYGGMYVTTEGGEARPFYGYYTGTAAAWHYLDGGTADWHLNVDGSERLTVTNEGNVGIDNTNPQSMLHVGGSYTPTVSGSIARFSGIVAAEGDFVSDGGNILSRAPSGLGAAILQMDAQADTGGESWFLVSHANNSPFLGDGGSFSLYSNATHVLTADQRGRLGVGTFPTAWGRFSVKQAAETSDDGITVINSTEQRAFRMWADGNNVGRLDSGASGTGLLAINAGGGDVGIATADPQAQLHVGAGTDTGPADGGYLILGQVTGSNVGFDNNEIMARDDGAPATLYLQNEGGTVRIANAGQGVLTVGDTFELESSEGGSDGAQIILRDAAGTATFETDAEENGGGSVAILRNSLGNTTIEIDSDESDKPALRVNDEDGNTGVELKGNVASSGWVAIRGSNGDFNVVMTRENANSNHGWIDVDDASGNPQAGCYVNSSGNGVVFGDTKSFRIPNPRNRSTEIWYASLEGPEAAAYARGTAKLVDGRAEIALPDHFVDVCSETAITVHLTPRSADSLGLAYVGSEGNKVLVRELGNGQGTYEFDYMVMDVRAGHEDFRVIREPLRRAAQPGVAESTETSPSADGTNVRPVDVNDSGAVTVREPVRDAGVGELLARIGRLEAALAGLQKTTSGDME
jgi:hypothetical protein